MVGCERVLRNQEWDFREMGQDEKWGLLNIGEWGF